METDIRKIKLNLGASPIWQKEGWHVLDHKLKRTEGNRIAGDALNMDLEDESCSVVFCSHVFEHIPHVRLPLMISEINRILIPDGILRILTPDLEILAKAYVNKDVEFFNRAKKEDESLRTDLGLGGMFINFIVSPGQDTALIDRNLRTFISGYAHLYSYDYEMLSLLCSKLGFECCKSEFCRSAIEEMREPLHVKHLPPDWHDFNQEFYAKNGLIHRLVEGKYEINFKLTGFDRDPLTSLIVEARKLKFVNKKEADNLYNHSVENYNRYAFSLLSDKNFVKRLNEIDVSTYDI